MCIVCKAAVKEAFGNEEGGNGKGLCQTVANLFQGLRRLKVRRKPKGVFACTRCLATHAAHRYTQPEHALTNDSRIGFPSCAPVHVCCDQLLYVCVWLCY